MVGFEAGCFACAGFEAALVAGGPERRLDGVALVHDLGVVRCAFWPKAPRPPLASMPSPRACIPAGANSLDDPLSGVDHVAHVVPGRQVAVYHRAQAQVLRFECRMLEGSRRP